METGAFKGAGVFVEDAALCHRLIYSEQGDLQIGDYKDVVERRYFYDFADLNHSPIAHDVTPAPIAPVHIAQVYFDDERFFQDLDLSTGMFSTTHDCQPDLYEGLFTAHTPHHWGVVWRITGPRKDMTIKSDYRIDRPF